MKICMFGMFLDCCAFVTSSLRVCLWSNQNSQLIIIYIFWIEFMYFFFLVHKDYINIFCRHFQLGQII